MTHEFTLALLRVALLTGVAIVLVLLIRKALRRSLGAVAAYQAWLVVPCVAIAAVLPGPSAPLFTVAPGLSSVDVLAAQATPQVPARPDVLFVIWAGGALAVAAWFILTHQVFLRRAGRLTRSGGVYVSAAGAGPASVGLLRPRIIVPHDFHERYSPAEQALVVAHEQTHIDRGDALANLLAAAFQCVFWFNPLCHLGARYFRQDQEIACDAAVMRRHPRQRRTYAEALLKSQDGAVAVRTGIHCHWQSHHPIKERLMNLQSSPSGSIRRIVGRCTVVLLAASMFGATLGVRAEQGKAAPAYLVEMAFDTGGGQVRPRVLAKAGEAFAVASGDWRLEMVVQAGQAADQVWLKGKLLKGADVVSSPTLLGRLDEKATIKVGEGENAFGVSMVVSRQAAAATGR